MKRAKVAASATSATNRRLACLRAYATSFTDDPVPVPAAALDDRQHFITTARPGRRVATQLPVLPGDLGLASGGGLGLQLSQQFGRKVRLPSVDGAPEALEGRHDSLRRIVVCAVQVVLDL